MANMNIEDVFTKMSLSGKSAVELMEKNKTASSNTDVDIYYLQVNQYTGTSKDSVADGRLAILCSTHNVRIYDSTRLVRTATINGSEAQVSKVRFGHNSPDLVYTCSLDSKIRSWDLRTKLEAPASTFKVSGNTSASFLSFDMTHNDRFLCAGTKLHKENVYVYFWDHRQPDSVGCYEDLHSDDITQVRFHPKKQDMLLTASDDGLVNCLDISQPSEEDALLYTLDTTSTPDKLAWLDDDSAFISTFCNTAYIWNTDTGDESVKRNLEHFQDQVKTHRVDYLVDCFVNSCNAPTLLAGNDKCDGLLFTLSEEPSTHLGTLPSAHSEWIRACCYNKTSQSLYTVGEDALLCCWKPSESVKASPSNSRSAKAGHTKSARDRKPYARP